MRSLLYILILFVITGCSYSSSHVFRELDEVETLMQTDSSAAMKRLNKYDISEQWLVGLCFRVAPPCYTVKTITAFIRRQQCSCRGYLFSKRERIFAIQRANDSQPTSSIWIYINTGSKWHNHMATPTTET